MVNKRVWIWCIRCALALVVSPAIAEDLGDLTSLSLEELMQVEVTLAGKKEQALSTVPAAAFVITSEDIRRSTATSIAELLQTVPGMHSAQITASASAVSSRGPSGRFANKLLVMIDGRSVYTPLFSGVFWELQNLVLTDIDRIEIIRGPGGALWGSNAVNGIINIVTKSAQDTGGGHVATRIGNEQNVIEGRYGFSLSDTAALRIYGLGSKHEVGYSTTGAHDDWRDLRLGFRLDQQFTDDDKLTIQGDLFETTIGLSEFIPSASATTLGDTIIDDGDYTGNNLLARWEHDLSTDSNLSLQFYWDHAAISSPATEYDRDTIDVDFQHRFQIGDRHEIVWGLGYRGIYDTVNNTAVISTPQSRQHVEQKSGFLQDEITIIPETLTLTAGSKVEHNDYTGTEFQPTARLSWSLGKQNTLWASYTGAVRTPSRSENDMSLNIVGIAPPATFITISGNTELESETLDAYEVGWRVGMKSGLVLDMTAYYHNYNNLLAYEANGFDLIPMNHMEGESYGFEAALQWHLNERWQLHGTYTYSTLLLHLDPTSPSVDAEVAEGAFPTHQATAGTSWTPSDTLEFDATLRYADNLVSVDIERFVDLDLRAAWHPNESVEISIRGRNLLDSHRAEFATDSVSKTAITEVRRSVTLELIYRF